MTDGGADKNNSYHVLISVPGSCLGAGNTTVNKTAFPYVMLRAHRFQELQWTEAAWTGAHRTLSPNPGLGVSGPDFLEKLIAPLRRRD